METRLEKSRRLRQAALPEVKKLISKFGRQAVKGAVEYLYEIERRKKRLEEAKAEVEELEESIAE